jgi:heme exporter protein B
LRIDVENLACRRSGRLVFEGLSFSVAEGQILLATGRNGAGKSSLLGILSGQIRPESGAIRAEGLDERTLSEALHLVGHRDALKGALTAEENLSFARDLLGDSALPPLEALEAVGLAHAAPLPVAYLSAGQRRRVALARLLVARRPLWLLDEPTAALDAAAQETLFGLMRTHLAGGGLIVAATHAALPIEEARELRIGRTPPSPLRGGEGVEVEGPERDGAAVGSLDWESGGSTAPPTVIPGEPERSVGEGRGSSPRRRLDPLPDALRASPGMTVGGGEITRPFLALVTRDLRLAGRVGGSGALGLIFFLMIVTLVPFALGPDLNLLSRIGPAILWLAAVLATLIGLDRLFQADAEDGSLDLLRQSPLPLELVVLAKAIAHWLATGLPLALAAPLFGLLVALPPLGMAAVAATLLAGTPALTFIGAVGAALTSGMRRGGLILAILVLPLMIPTLIFGVSAANAALGGTVPFATPFLILAALSLVAAVVGTVGAAAALRTDG